MSDTTGTSTDLADELQAHVDRIANAIKSDTVDVYFKEAAAKFVIRQLAWALVDDCGVLDQDVAEQLETMAGIMRDRPRAASDA